MKRVIDTSEVLGAVETPEGPCEVCASIEAMYDESTSRLQMNLHSFLRPAGYLVKERHFRADWLPQDEVVEERVAWEECHDLTREVFHRWVRKVRDASPSLHHV